MIVTKINPQNKLQHSDVRIVAEWAEILRQELKSSGVTGYEVILPKPEDHPGDNSSRIEVSFYKKNNFSTK